MEVELWDVGFIGTSLKLLKVWPLGSTLMSKRSGIRRIILFKSANELFEYGGYLLNEPRQTHKQRQRHHTSVVKVKPRWSELRIVHQVGRVISTEPPNHIAGEGSEGMIHPHYFPGTLQAFEPIYDQLFAELCHHRFQLCHATSRKVRVEWLSSLAVELMPYSPKMRSLKVDKTTDESGISVRWADGARDVEFIVVFVVTNGKLMGVNPNDRSYMI